MIGKDADRHRLRNVVIFAAIGLAMLALASLVHAAPVP